MSWFMPAETAPQHRVWMAFPTTGYTLGDTPAEAHEARTTWAAVAHAVASFEPVTMVVDPADRQVVRQYLSADVEVVEHPLDDAWMRDIGPTFVVNEHGKLGAVDWIFNGWGQQSWACWERDATVGAAVAAHAGAELISSPLVNEGGGVHVDGRGSVLLTETVQQDQQRNPGWGKAAIEEELARTLGVSHAVWLPRGLTRDAQRFGTRGHVDILATSPAPGNLLLHTQTDPAHPDHAVTATLRERIDESVDADGNPWRVTELPAPKVLRDDVGWVDYSYVNHLVVNGGVIACSFDDPNDALAADTLAAAYPGREVVSVDARPIFARGGGIHCITQQQPAC